MKLRAKLFLPTRSWQLLIISLRWSENNKGGLQREAGFSGAGQHRAWRMQYEGMEEALRDCSNKDKAGKKVRTTNYHPSIIHLASRANCWVCPRREDTTTSGLTATQRTAEQLWTSTCQSGSSLSGSLSEWPLELLWAVITAYKSMKTNALNRDALQSICFLFVLHFQFKHAQHT